MDRAALSAALAAGLLAPAGLADEGCEPAPRGVVCGDPAAPPRQSLSEKTASATSPPQSAPNA